MEVYRENGVSELALQYVFDIGGPSSTRPRVLALQAYWKPNIFTFSRVGELKKSPLEGGSSNAAGDVLFAAIHRRALPLTSSPSPALGRGEPLNLLCASSALGN